MEGSGDEEPGPEGPLQQLVKRQRKEKRELQGEGRHAGAGRGRRLGSGGGDTRGRRPLSAFPRWRPRSAARGARRGGRDGGGCGEGGAALAGGTAVAEWGVRAAVWLGLCYGSSAGPAGGGVAGAVLVLRMACIALALGAGRCAGAAA